MYTSTNGKAKLLKRLPAFGAIALLRLIRHSTAVPSPTHGRNPLYPDRRGRIFQGIPIITQKEDRSLYSHQSTRIKRGFLVRLCMCLLLSKGLNLTGGVSNFLCLFIFRIINNKQSFLDKIKCNEELQTGNSPQRIVVSQQRQQPCLCPTMNRFPAAAASLMMAAVAAATAIEYMHSIVNFIISYLKCAISSVEGGYFQMLM